jgi:cytochrome c553
LWVFEREGRKNPIMTMQVRKLGAQDIENLAAYISSPSCQEH